MLPLARPLHLRPFRLADARAVEPWLCGPGLSLPSGAARREWPQRLLADARIVMLVAEADDRQVGLVRLDCGPDRVAELTLVVAPECRRQGLGRKMFVAALTQARALGLRCLVALVDRDNDAALAFFHDLDFQPDGLVSGRLRLVRIVHAGDHQRPLVIEM
jgi:ribosomal protein S18 acetylase RimI-like enzyme